MNYKNRKSARALAILASTLLVACASSRLPRGLTSQFKTRITEGGLKHFQVQVLPTTVAAALARGETPEPEQTRYYDAGQRKRVDSDVIARHNRKLVLAQLEAMMESRPYCTSGFWVIDSNFYGQTPWLRGECNELATATDRKKFPDTISQW